MKRREFIANIGAAGGLGLLPNTVLAGGTNIPASLLARAEYMASLWVHSSAKMFQNAFDLDAKTAGNLFDIMTQRGIVGQANQYGVARASLPCFENPIFIAKREVARAKLNNQSAAKSLPDQAKKHTRKRLKSLGETADAKDLSPKQDTQSKADDTAPNKLTKINEAPNEQT